MIIKCPAGFAYNTTSMICEICTICDPSVYQTSMKYGVACLRNNYWYGMTESGSVVI